MGGFFGVASKSDCVFDLFFGTDYHSHLGTKRGGMAVYGERRLRPRHPQHRKRAVPHQIRAGRGRDEGQLWASAASPTPSPSRCMVRSHHGHFRHHHRRAASTTSTQLVKQIFDRRDNAHFLEMSGGDINPTELAAALINQNDSICRGHPLSRRSVIDGSMSMLSDSRRRASTPPATGWAARRSSSAAKEERLLRLRLSRSPISNLGYDD